MNRISPSSNFLNIEIEAISIPEDPLLYKFLSIISNTTALENAFREQKVLSWLNKVEASEQDVKDYVNAYCYSDIVAFQRICKIALVYARILDPYTPTESGCINRPFHYLQLVKAVKEVFIAHILENVDLFTSGIQFQVESHPFLAKVKGDRICLLSQCGEILGKGAHGKVSVVYEIGLRQFLALKEETRIKKRHLETEIANLNQLHKRAKELNLSVLGLQEPPYATFNILGLTASAGKRYGNNLGTWIRDFHTNTERLTMCQSLMQAYKNKTALDFWHGDLKAENILLLGNKCVIIDWEGAITYEKALKSYTRPKIYSSTSMSYFDRYRFTKLVKENQLLWKENEEILSPCDWKEDPNSSNLFLKIAKAQELFSIATLLFRILTSCDPFEFLTLNKRSWPDTGIGISDSAMSKLHDKNYSLNVVQTITKMLAHDLNDRYEEQEAIKIWEEIQD